MTTGPSPIDRKLYGDLADDVILLRSDGRVVARFKGGFRVDSSPEIFSAAQVRGLAVEVRARRQAAVAALGHRKPPDNPRRQMARHSVEPAPERLTEGPRSTYCDAAPYRIDLSGRDAAEQSKQKTAVGIPPGEGEGTTEINGGPGSALATNPFDESCGRTERRRASEAMDGANAALSADLNAQSEMAEGVATRQAGVATGPQDTIGEPRSPAFTTSDSIPTVEPVVPTGNEGRAGERGTTDCPCGRPTGHGGRCWFIRGNPGPTLKRRPAGAVKCTACGGPRSISARGDLCRKCVLAKHRRSPGQATRITALEAEVAANKAELAAFKATVKAAVADLCAHLGLGETR